MPDGNMTAKLLFIIYIIFGHFELLYINHLEFVEASNVYHFTEINMLWLADYRDGPSTVVMN